MADFPAAAGQIKVLTESVSNPSKPSAIRVLLAMEDVGLVSEVRIISDYDD